MAKYVYTFGGGKAEGNASMKNLLGGKGSNLGEMAGLGIPVPPGFTITTEVCTYYYENDGKYPEGLEKQVQQGLRYVEKVMGAKFGNRRNPLLVSVRSGARVSMPGMMDTVLNLGLNDETIQGLIAKTKNPRMAYDSYRRFVQMYADVVMGAKGDEFEELIRGKKKEKGVKDDTELTAEDWQELVGKFKEVVREKTGKDFPTDPKEQLWGAIGAVFRSWDTPRAVSYRQLHHIPEDWGTAVSVQAMVFGNMGESSATGVAFTRDPSTGDKRFFGEFLINAQGEDVVAGIRTPHPITIAGKRDSGLTSLEEEMPEIYQQLVQIYEKLEQHYKEMQDIEFTIQEGKLYMLQTRTGKRTGFAAIRIAVDMVDEGLIDQEEALKRVEPAQLLQLLAPIFETEAKQKAVEEGRLLAKGLNAGPGAACGRVVFSAEKAVEMARKGEKVILTRTETSPEDISGMAKAAGILTSTGGTTSHAAVVARGMGKSCIVGCGALNIDYATGTITVRDKVIKEGDYVSIDGTTGEVILGQLPTIPSEVIQVLVQKTKKPEESRVYQQFDELMTWADKHRKLGIRTNADTPGDAAVARKFGAEGIGLTRTEHMFFEGDRIDAVREMILAEDSEGRKRALAKIMPMQKEDFIGIFEAMEGLPVTIRTLDPPLHEFLPHTDKEIEELAGQMGVEAKRLKQKVQSLHEANPMLGHRGCRLGIAYPEITEMQARAIVEAACELIKKGKKVEPEIMIPLVGHINELRGQKEIVDRVAKETAEKYGVAIEYKVGTMIELPRAALTADQVALEAEFFSFGTNDLTQTTFGISRDDAGTFLPMYVEKRILPHDPFQSIDRDGVGALMKIGVEKGRATRPDLKIGICGEHGGDPDSVEFCHEIGLNYVSCSPYRVPIARLAAARANLGVEAAVD
ncbi:MAG: pyruvate, phosphate dikinase [bacterium]|nr:pyruvate, phosphate dikinase [bacterium]